MAKSIKNVIREILGRPGYVKFKDLDRVMRYFGYASVKRKTGSHQSYARGKEDPIIRITIPHGKTKKKEFCIKKEVDKVIELLELDVRLELNGG